MLNMPRILQIIFFRMQCIEDVIPDRKILIQTLSNKCYKY